MKSLENKTPPAVMWLVCALVMRSTVYILPFVALPHLPIVAMVIALIGIEAGIAGIWGSYKAGTTINPLEPSQIIHFVSEGIHKLNRNPMYAGLACCLISWTI